MSPSLHQLIGKLAAPAPRLPWLVDWLSTEVWSADMFSSLSAEEYLLQGEKLVHNAEELLIAAAYRVYDELAAAAKAPGGLMAELDPQTAAVVFDGASLREVPIFLKKAEESGFEVTEQSVRYAALPSETVSFVEQRLIGKPVAPKLLPQRQELRERGVTSFYFSDAIASQNVRVDEGNSLLLWSAFPDVTYKDSESRFTRHFTGMQPLYDAAWKNTVMQAPRERRILVTSDHGYIFFGAGFDSTRPNNACALLDQHRNRKFAQNEELPDPRKMKDLQVFSEERLAMVRGRLKNQPQGPSANFAYRHGGLSLMEMLVPWIVLKRK